MVFLLWWRKEVEEEEEEEEEQSANYTMTIGGVNFFSMACIDPPDLLF